MGRKAAIQEASLLSTGKGLLLDCKIASEGEDQPKQIPAVKKLSEAVNKEKNVLDKSSLTNVKVLFYATWCLLFNLNRVIALNKVYSLRFIYENLVSSW